MRNFILTTTLLLISTASNALAQEFVANHLFIASGTQDGVIEYDQAGTKVRIISTGNGSDPWGVAFGPNGHLYTSLRTDDVVREFDAAGNLVSNIGTGNIDFPEGIAFGPNGHLYVCSFATDRVVEFTEAGALVRSIGSGTSLDGPDGVAIAPDGQIWVCAFASGKLYEFNPDGILLREFNPGGLDLCNSICILPNGNIAVGNLATTSFLIFNPNGANVGNIIPNIGNYFGIAVGPDNNLYVHSSTSGTIKRFTLGGVAAGADIGTAIDLAAGGNIAFAPFRFKATVSGTLFRSGDTSVKITEAAEISYAPGSRTVMLQLVDGASTTDLTSFFGNNNWIMNGFETNQLDRKKGIQFQGAQTDFRTLLNGMVQCMLSIALKIDKVNQFAIITKITGPLTRGNGAGTFNGKVSSGALLK